MQVASEPEALPSGHPGMKPDDWTLIDPLTSDEASEGGVEQWEEESDRAESASECKAFGRHEPFWAGRGIYWHWLHADMEKRLLGRDSD